MCPLPPTEESYNESIIYSGITEGMKLSSNPFALEITQSPYLVNVDISKKGIIPRKGYDHLFIEFPSWVRIISTHDYFDIDGEYTIIAVSYPHIIRIFPKTRSWRVIYSGWNSDFGKPEAAQSPESLMIVDGVNSPLFITKNEVEEMSWPQVLTNPNNDPGGSGDLGNIVDSPYNQAATQQPSDAGKPNHVIYLNDRFQLTDTKYRRRIWFGRIFDHQDFATNDPANWDIAFFIDLPTPYGVTGWKVLNNEAIVIYLDHGYVIQTGNQPPGEGYPEVPMSWKVRSSANGLQHHKLLTSNGDGDHFFFSNNGRLYSLQSSDNFNQAKPKGLSEPVFPIFEKFNSEMWELSTMVNDQLRGELRLFCPTDDEDGYATRCLIYKYAGDQGETGWTQEALWGDDFEFSTAHVDAVDNIVYVINKGNRMLVANTGHTFDGEAVRMIAELRPEAFEDVSRYKELLGVIMVSSSNTAAEIIYTHRWDSDEEGLERISTPQIITKDTLEDFTELEYNIISDVGEGYTYSHFPVKNRNGIILKQRIETKNSQDIQIFLIALVFRRHGTSLA